MPPDSSQSKTAPRLLAVFLCAALLFNPPLLTIVDRPVLVLGVPLIYLYLFVGWTLIVFGLRWVLNSVRDKGPDGHA